MTTQRSPDRIETSLQATIRTAGAPPMVCLVKDISAFGAKLEVGAPQSVPSAFTLTISRTGETFEAETRWRYGPMIGVRFAKTDAQIEDGPSRDDLVTENNNLWDALQTLATRLTQLGEHVVLPPELMRPRLARTIMAPKETPAPLRPTVKDDGALLSEPAMH